MSVDEIYDQGFQARCEGRYPEAKECFNRVLQMQPGHINASLQNALILGFEGDFDGSLASLDALSKANPANQDVRYELAMTQIMLGMNDEACANFHEVLRQNPGHEKAKQQIVYC